MEKFVPATGFQAAAIGGFEAITDFTDVTAKVSLITTSFVASPDIDETTIPANVTEFTQKTSSATPTMTATVDPPGQSLVWPDPAGGWNFQAGAGTYPLTVYGYRVDATGDTFLGCQNIPAQVIENAGEWVLIGVVRVPVSDLPLDGE